MIIAPGWATESDQYIPRRRINYTTKPQILISIPVTVINSRNFSTPSILSLSKSGDQSLVISREDYEGSERLVVNDPRSLQPDNPGLRPRRRAVSLL